ncbi:MAG TPA: isoaspartyl peptidase/L-asparaginase, partial [Anaerolineae bacterium]|nr:isoaspartyl peptidase/L-asparaginase [Anaerolineae bacterium]
IPSEQQDAHRAGTRRAVDAGWAVLEAGGSAMDAVEAAIVVMEDDETFDAGRGSFLNAEGQVELDAGCMDGGAMLVGAVAGVQFIQNPIRLARAVMEKSEHVLLVAGGAQRFAQRMGFRACDLTDLAVPREFERWQKLLYDRTYSARSSFDRPGGKKGGGHDTVGCVARDAQGHVAAGTSTGGTPNKMPGRVGDVPMVGSGFYADDDVGGASTTGWGESIAKVLLARLALGKTEDLGDPMVGARAAIEFLESKVNGLGGVIVLAPDGRPGWHHNTPHMAFAYRTEGMDAPVVSL